MSYGCEWTWWGDWGGGRRLISTDILDSGEAAEDYSIDNDGDDLDEDDESGLGEAGVSTVVTEVGTK